MLDAHGGHITRVVVQPCPCDISTLIMPRWRWWLVRGGPWPHGWPVTHECMNHTKAVKPRSLMAVSTRHVSRDVSTHISVESLSSGLRVAVARRRAGPTLDLSSHVTQSLTSGHSPSSGSHVSRTRQGTCSVDFGLRAAARGAARVPRLFWRKQKSKRSNLYIIHTDHTSETLPRMGRHS